MPLDVSVVVPVHNPGANIDACLQSLVIQTLPRDRYEVVLVDDGSDDGTATVLDYWAARHPDLLSVLHEPASGSPGRPRNVGIDVARGDYVQLLDSDDALTPRSLEAALSAARRVDADVVVPKLASDFRGLNHDVWRTSATGTWWDLPVIETLTPHRMLRRRFLAEHGIRFDDRPRYLEDQLFLVHVYAHAQTIAVVADEVCCLFLRRRGFGGHRGEIVAHPDEYFRHLEDVLDVVDVHVDAAERPRIYERFLRVEMLGRLRDRTMLEYDDDYRRHLFQRVRELVVERVPRATDDLLPPIVRRQAELVRSCDLVGSLALARMTTQIQATARVEAVDWRDGRLAVAVTFVAHLPAADGGFDTDILVDADVVLVGRHDSSTWFVGEPFRFRADEAVAATVEVDPRSALFGRPLPAGLWDLRLRARIGGVTRTVRFDVDDAEMLTCLYDGEPRTVAPYRTAAGGLALDVDGWSHSLTERVAADAVVESPGKSWRVRSVVAPDGASCDAQVFVSVADGGIAVQAARLRAGPSGSTLVCRRRLPSGDMWIRIGPPGGNAPSRLGAVSPAS